MKRQKRDTAHRAFLRGYQVGYEMKTKSLCPFDTESNTGIEWLRGWREGRQDQWQGYKPHTCQQKVSAL
jgi:ribosome modulation factor